MWILLSVLNIAFAHFADKNYGNNKNICKLYLFLIVVANVIILGLRDIGVGFDTTMYVNSYFYKASSLPFFKVLLLNDSEFDKGYLLIAWLSNLLSNDSQMLMLLTEALIIFFFVAGLYELKKSINYSMTWFMLLFVFRYQHETVNLMRQFCAMSILFYGYSLFLQKKYAIYIICQLISYFFHSTSIIFLSIIIAQILSQSKGNTKYLYFAVVLVSVSFLLFFYFYLISYIGELNMLRDDYSERYASNSQWLGSNKISISTLIISFVGMIICYYTHKSKCVPSDIFYVLFFVFCLELIFRLSSFWVMCNFHRLAYYYGLLFILYIASVIKTKVKFLHKLCYTYTLLALIIIIRAFIDDAAASEHYLMYKSQILDMYLYE